MTLGKPGVAGSGPDQFNPADRRRRRAERRHLRRRRPRRQHQRAHREVHEGRQVHQDVGQERLGAAASSTCRTRSRWTRSGRLFVGDRENNRIQIFDQDGKFLDEWTQFGRPSGIFIDAERHHLRRRFRIGIRRQESRRLEARHPHRQREGRLGDGVHPRSRRESHRHERGGRRRRGCEGQHLRRRSRPEADDEIRPKMTSVAASDL